MVAGLTICGEHRVLTGVPRAQEGDAAHGASAVSVPAWQFVHSFICSFIPSAHWTNVC